MEHVNIKSIVKPFRVRNGKRFSLDDIKPGDTLGLNPTKEWAAQVLREGVRRLIEERHGGSSVVSSAAARLMSSFDSTTDDR